MPMSTAPPSNLELAKLAERIRHLEKKEALQTEVDDALEVALQERLPLAQTVASVLPLLMKHLGARRAFLRTYDEGLGLTDYGAGEALPLDGDALDAAVDRSAPYRADLEEGTLLACRLDVAGDDFGLAATWFERILAADEQARAVDLLTCFTEVLDNYLASIAWARHKHQVIGRLSDALKAPVLDEGLDAAIAVLRQEVGFEDLLLAFRHEDDAEGASLHYKIIRGDQITHDSSAGPSEEATALRAEAAALLSGASRDLLDRLGITRFREEVLISGVRDERIVGRLIVTHDRGDFSTHDRDLLETFADNLRQRIVDFNREWKHLSLCFPPAVVERLLHEESYRTRYLKPQERDVAILYADISGFTRLSEQVLQQPALIGRLVDTWSAEAVDIIWQTGGVFDKMVGDCVIGLWGPPFFEHDARMICRQAAEAARRIRDFTRSLCEDERLPELRGLEPPIGVASGLSYCPLLVGTFGPNEAYTGFSSGMNNTSRLQGVATRDEILCMEDFVQAFDDAAAFGEQRSAKVKNVTEPLRFRPLE
jgi:class 3 adenylate cyclase